MTGRNATWFSSCRRCDRKTRRRSLWLVVLVLAWGTIRPCHAAGDDWFGRDKALHFTASAALAGVGYGVGAAVDDRTSVRLGIGAGLALGAGLGKELYDLSGRGDASWRDLTWDAIGTVTGLVISFLVDQAVSR